MKDSIDWRTDSPPKRPILGIFKSSQTGEHCFKIVFWDGSCWTNPDGESEADDPIAWIELELPPHTLL
jgi:hypothetical protein